MEHNNAENTNSSCLICPVPREQLPIIKYLILRKKRFFRWAILDRTKYTIKLLGVWVTGVILSLFIFAAGSTYDGASLTDFLRSIVVGKIAVLICSIELYRAWNNVHLCLTNSKVVYRVSSSKNV